MENVLWLLLLAVILVVAFVAVRGRRRRVAEEARQDQFAAASTPDFIADRETSRLGQMSAEDRAWEQESQRKQRERS